MHWTGDLGMEPEKLAQEWNELSAAWIKEAREGRNANRNGLLDWSMLAACGEVTGMNVLDCGCGEGRFCRMLVERGARSVLGIDLCPAMIEAARALQSEGDTYRVADAQDLRFIEGETFDLAVSYLNQCDLPDFSANDGEVYRILKPGGRFVIANLHPMRSATGGWHQSADGGKQHAILDDYFGENERHWRMMGVEFTNFHRTLATYINDFVQTGFTITKIVEPTVSAEQLEKYPELQDELRVPNFIVYILTKP